MFKASKKILAAILAVLIALSCSVVAFATDLSALPTFKLTTVSNEGGYVQILKELYYPGELVTVKAAPFDGFAFYTWVSDDVQFSTVLSDTTTFIMPAKNVTIGALFAIKQTGNKETITVTFNTMGGSEIETATVEVGGCVAKPATDPVKEGYTFAGWHSDANCTLLYDFETKLTTSTFLYAKWSKVIETPKVETPVVEEKPAVEEKPVVEETKDKFVDVKSGDWFYEYVNALADKKIVSGVGDSKFAPSNNISRAQFVTILANFAGAELVDSESVFSDVAADAWYAKAVAWAYENGIAKGTSSETFAPNANVTRQDMAVMIMRYVNNVEKKELAPTEEKSEFGDDADIAEYAKESVYTMQRCKIIGGKPGNVFDPVANATRAEACKMIYVLMDLLGK